MAKSRFITSWERRQRIEALLKRKGWSWYMLSKLMNYNQTSVQRAFKVERGAESNPTLPMVKACAIALGVSAAFFIDRKET